jgi:hypothetical protein
MDFAGDSDVNVLSGERSGDLSGDFSGDLSGDWGRRGCRVGDNPGVDRRSFKASSLARALADVSGVTGDKFIPDVVRGRGVVCVDGAAED